jgi:hypothetical protein
VAISFADALERAHTALLNDLQRLEEACRPVSTESLPRLQRRLRDTQKHITEHFRFEEQNGYMDSVRKREPRLARTVDDLAMQHGQLSQFLDDLIGEAEAARSLEEGLQSRVGEWIRAVQAHESAENRLVQEVFNLDLGAED